MICSMTGFAREQKQLDTAQLCWEIRSVNHRYLDVSFRLPEPFRFLEPQLRLALKNNISRGKLECQFKYQDNNNQEHALSINQGMVNAIIDCGNHLASTNQLANDLKVSHIVTWPGVLHAPSFDTDELAPPILALFKQAILQLSQFRQSEGQALKEHIQMRLDCLANEVARAKIMVQDQAITTKEKLLARVRAIKMDVVEERIEQEIALLLARMDVAEELDRLQTHIKEVHKALIGSEASGRKLDFLMQELNREANTLSAKADSSDLTQCAIEMKVLIEQMREQIQNIE